MYDLEMIEHIFYATSNFLQNFVAICEFKLQLQSENARFGSKLTIFDLHDLAIWRMTLKKNKASLLCHFIV